MSIYSYSFDEDEEERKKRLCLLPEDETDAAQQTPMSEMSTRDAIAAAYDKQHPYGGYATMTGPLGNISYYDENLNAPKEDKNMPDGLTQNPPERKLRYAELTFDGKNLNWLENNEVKKSWPAMSGDPDYQSAKFTSLKGAGPIPEGLWKVNQDQNQNFDDLSIPNKLASYVGGVTKRIFNIPLGGWPGGTVAWGNHRVPLEAAPGTDTQGRTDVFLHGGSSLGSKGCVDLAQNMDDFWEWYRKYGQNMNLNVKYPRKW